MNSNTKLAIGVVVLVLLCAGLAVWQLGSDAESGAPPEEAQRVAREVDPLEDPVDPAPEIGGGSPGSSSTTETRKPGDGGSASSGQPPTADERPNQTPGEKPFPRDVVRGTVRAGKAGEPVPGVTVTIEYDVAQNGGRVPEGGVPRLTVESDEHGEFRFDKVVPGAYRITFAHPDYAHRALPGTYVGAGDDLTHLEVPLVGALETLGEIAGRVTLPDGSPHSGARIVVEAADRTARLETRTDELGQYRVERLAAGYYRVSLMGETAESEAGDGAKLYERLQIALVEPRKIARADFEGTGTLTGVVNDELGAPMPGVTVQVEPLEIVDGYRQRGADADENGKFRIEDAGIGWQKVWVNAKKLGWWTQVSTVNLSGYDHEITIALPPGRIGGRITIAEDGSTPRSKGLFPGITLRLLGPDRERPIGPNVALAHPDKSGRFDMRGLSDGEYRLSLRVDGYHADERDVLVRSGEPTPAVDLVLRKFRVGTVKIRVTDPSGNPAQGIYFSSRPEGGNWHSFQMERPEPGVYISDKVPLGKREFIVYRKDLERKIVTVEVTEGETADLEVSMVPKR